MGYDNKSNRIRVLNSITGIVRMEQDVRFAKFSNFKEEEKSTNKIWHESLSTSSLAKLLKIPTLPTTPILSPLIKTVFTNSLASDSTIEAIHKSIYEETQSIANKYPYCLQNPSWKAYNILEDCTVIAVEEED